MRALTTSLLFLIVFALVAAAQNVTPGNRPIDRTARRLDMNNTMPSPRVPVLRPRVDPARIKSEADDIARLAQAIPAQINQVQHGVLPKDLGENLKQIEKLTKHLRRDLNL